ncbi:MULTISPECIES: hypothetical protein [Deefgea]|uniref:DUF5668 domain-containing protein n=1 Tax=Deefgea chitinilytica TaxID=570276 RepID=A0ABS2C918_9NEIS|nr:MULTISPECIES: hypothetical protein [Deefgea]MBM5570645.1 hypothetical protein [Deefgea chitinilytica]MBM9887874.1 hypothetical protein [Deefgea sp. CFH1-16]
MRGIVFPVVLIVIGAGWLLNEMNYFPSVSWIIILGLFVAGIAVLAVDGINKSTIVLGPMLIAGAVTTFLRQQFGLGLSVQLPVLLILCGCLMLLARSNLIRPAPPKPWEKLPTSSSRQE